MDPQLQQFYRQYIQQFSHLTFPPGYLLKQDDIQKSLEQHFFNDGNKTNIPSSYQARTLDKIISLIEGAVRDPEEEDVPDFLYEGRAELALTNSHGLPALERSTLFYTAPTALDLPAVQITISEAKNIIGAGPNVGLRTWEASLRLAHYLFQNQELISNRHVLELGAGTGFLSLFSSLSLGAKSVFATDGEDQVLDSLRENITLNQKSFEEDDANPPIPSVRKLAWEDPDNLNTALQTETGQPIKPDIILGADVTYHPDACASLASLLARLIKVNHAAQILIAATERSVKTLDDFFAMCRREEPRFEIEEVEFKCPVSQQKGFFHNVFMPIRIFKIYLGGKARESEALREVVDDLENGTG